MTLIWHSEFGQQVRQVERQPLSSLTRRLHGETVLWIGSDIESARPLQRCMTRNPTVLLQDLTARPQSRSQPAEGAVTSVNAGEIGQIEGGPDMPRAILVGDPCELPFKSNSIDGLVLHHALESVSDPRVALREAVRVLTPGGRLLVCGFNPFSMVGVQRLYAHVATRFVEHPLHEHKLINPIRMFDWFALLGLDLDRQPHYFAYALPFGRRVAQQRDTANARKLSSSDADATRLPVQEGGIHALRTKVHEANLPFAGLLLVSAVKQAISLRPKWRKAIEQRKLAPVAYPSVASWRRAEDWKPQDQVR